LLNRLAKTKFDDIVKKCATAFFCSFGILGIASLSKKAPRLVYHATPSNRFFGFLRFHPGHFFPTAR
jgi:hypothetical protein